MPYIRKEDRPQFNRWIEGLANNIKTPGDLNYVISQLVRTLAPPCNCNYAKINELIGVLECAKLELYRRLAAPYEDTKIEANGDVTGLPDNT